MRVIQLRCPVGSGILLSVLLSLPAAAASPQLVPVQVRIRAAGGEPLREAYVAFVPGWRPVHAPLVEKIVHDGRYEFRMPEDTYHVIVGAKGYKTLAQGPVTFTAAAGGGKLDLTLEALSEASGTVMDADGNPLAGVRVADTRAVAAPPFGGVSELAMRQLSQDWSTVTDREGNWKLRVPKGSVPIVFSASGRAAQFRIWRSTDPQPIDVVMAAGASLRLTADRADPAAVITLERDGEAPQGSIPRDWQRQLWARWVTTPLLSWDSLLSGSYAVYAKYFDSAYFMQRAVKIGEVIVPATGTAEIQVRLPPPLRPAGPIARLYVQGISPDRLTGDELEAYGVDERSAPHRLATFVESTVGGSVIHMNADAASGPFFAATGTQFFSAAVATSDANVTAAAAAVRERADAYADIRSAQQELELPRGGMAVLRDCASAEKGQGGTVSVPIEIRSGHIAHLIAPANCASAVMAFSPFEPILLPKPLHRGDQSLGEFALRAAASADVHVVGGADATMPGAIVRVMTEEPGTPMVVAEATTATNGWAHIAMLPVLRDIRVVAQSPDGDTSDGRSVRAKPLDKLTIDPLRIPSPATLIVAAKMSGAVRAVFPASQVRMVLLQPREMHADESERRERVRDDSPVRFEHLKAGIWKVAAIVTVAGSDTFIDLDEVELKAGEIRQLEKEIEPFIYACRVTIGGKGVEARVTLSNLSAVSSVRPHFESRPDGSFYAILPNRGTYRVTVARRDAQQAAMPAGDIDFEDPSRPIEITLPALASAVVHVRANDEPVPQVLVSTRLQSATLDQAMSSGQLAQTDAKGEARFAQLLPGQWVFTVREQRNGRSAEKAITLTEGGIAEVTIEMERAATITGTLRQADGQPAAQAHVACYSVGPANLPTRSAADTQVEGRFTIELAGNPSNSALCSVVTPAGDVDAFSAAPDRPVVVQLSGATGQLRIDDWGKWGNPETFWLVASDGRAISLSAVDDTLRRAGTSLLIPALAAGRWKVIRLQSLPQWVALVLGEGALLPGAAQITLQAGTTESLSIY